MEIDFTMRCDGEETPEKPDENTPEEPQDEDTPEKPESEKTPEIERVMEKMVAYKMELFGSASENIKDAQERMKKDYDRKRKPLSVSLLKIHCLSTISFDHFYRN